MIIGYGLNGLQKYTRNQLKALFSVEDYRVGNRTIFMKKHP